MKLFSISTRGTTRSPVVVIGPIVLKFAKSNRGRACNLYEAKLYGTTTEPRRRLLCPVIWVSSKGSVLVGRSAVPDESEMPFDRRFELTKKWDHMPGEDGHPFEWKPGDWGWYHGRLVALDYSATA